MISPVLIGWTFARRWLHTALRLIDGISSQLGDIFPAGDMIYYEKPLDQAADIFILDAVKVDSIKIVKKNIYGSCYNLIQWG